MWLSITSQGYVQSCISIYLCRKASVKAQQSICPKQPWPVCPWTCQEVMEPTGAQAEVRTAVMWWDRKWRDGTGLSPSMAVTISLREPSNSPKKIFSFVLSSTNLMKELVQVPAVTWPVRTCSIALSPLCPSGYQG